MAKGGAKRIVHRAAESAVKEALPGLAPWVPSLNKITTTYSVYRAVCYAPTWADAAEETTDIFLGLMLSMGCNSVVTACGLPVLGSFAGGMISGAADPIIRSGVHWVRMQIAPPSEAIVHLYYGQHMRDLLEERGSLIKIRSMIRTGNYRLNYYKKRRSFYDQLTERLIFSRFKNKKKTILYAPTRDSHEGPTSFFDSCGILIEELPKNYNLIVKLHPDLFEEFPAQTYRMIGKYSQHEGVLFVENFPPIYPLLARCACYLGDYSSVGYDFLAFNRPLFFVESHNKGLMRSAPTIRQCGMTIPFGKGIFPFIEKHIEENQQTYSSAREKMYSYTFGKDRDISDIKQELLYTS